METQRNVQHHLSQMIILENHIEQMLNSGEAKLTDCQDIVSAIRKFRVVAGEHREALDNRIQRLRAISDMSGHREDDDTTPALIRLYGVFCEAALGYSVLHALAHRSFDREGEGNTRDMVKKHLEDYSEIVKDINNFILDEIVRELDENGDECRCHCNTCELGICTCAPMGIGRTYKEWIDNVSSAPLGRILVTSPRNGSAAIQAGLDSGDTILAADGMEIHSNAELHAAIKEHEPGETIQLKVRRAPGDVEDISLTC